MPTISMSSVLTDLDPDVRTLTPSSLSSACYIQGTNVVRTDINQGESAITSIEVVSIRIKSNLRGDSHRYISFRQYHCIRGQMIDDVDMCKLR